MAVIASASIYIDKGGYCFCVRFSFFFKNNIFWDVLGYEDGVVKISGARRSGSGPEAFSQVLFGKNPPKSSYTYILTLHIIWLIQFFYIFVTWDPMWSRSGPVA